MNKIKELEHKLANISESDSVQILVELSELYVEIKEYDQALNRLRTAIKIASEEKADKQYIDCLLRIGYIYLNQHRFETALEYFEQAILLCNDVSDRMIFARLQMAKGITYLNIGEYVKAVESLRQAIYLMIRLHDKADLRYAYNWLGIAYDSIEDFSDALKYFLKGLALQEELADKAGIANAKNSIGLLKLKLNSRQEAVKLINESLTIRKELNDEDGIAACLNNLGMVYQDSDLSKALDYFQRSLAIRQKIGGKAKLADIFRNIGNIQLQKEDHALAISSYKAALQIKEEIGDKAGILNLQQDLAKAFLEKNDVAESKAILEKAIIFQAENPNLRANYQIYEMLARFYKKNKEFSKALECYEKYIELKQNYYQEETIKKMAELQTKYDLEKHQRENRIYRLKNIELHFACDKIKDQNQELKKQSEYLQLINRILGHDIKNNLSIISNAFRQFEQDGSTEYLQNIPAQIDKSFDLLKKLSKISYLVKNEHFIENMDVNLVLSNLIQSYLNIEFEIVGKARIKADFLLESVFDNLISNAIKHGKSTKIKIVIKSQGDDVFLDFIDNGSGIPHKFKDHIFQENFFYGASGNTGLGLFIVKKAVENYGGSVSLRDNHPQGAIFTLKLKRVI